MRTAVERYSNSDMAHLKRAVEAVGEWLRIKPDAPESVHEERLWSCHAVCRAVRSRFLTFAEWQVVDGFFSTHYQHSWLHNEVDHLILDVYPVASVGTSLLVDAGTSAPWHALYKANPDVYGKRRQVFEEHAKMFLEASP